MDSDDEELTAEYIRRQLKKDKAAAAAAKAWLPHSSPEQIAAERQRAEAAEADAVASCPAGDDWLQRVTEATVAAQLAGGSLCEALRSDGFKPVR